MLDPAGFGSTRHRARPLRPANCHCSTGKGFARQIGVIALRNPASVGLHTSSG